NTSIAGIAAPAQEDVTWANPRPTGVTGFRDCFDHHSGPELYRSTVINVRMLGADKSRQYKDGSNNDGEPERFHVNLLPVETRQLGHAVHSQKRKLRKEFSYEPLRIATWG